MTINFYGTITLITLDHNFQFLVHRKIVIFYILYQKIIFHTHKFEKKK